MTVKLTVDKGDTAGSGAGSSIVVAGEARGAWKGKTGPAPKVQLQQPKQDGAAYHRFNAAPEHRTELVQASTDLYPLDEVQKFLHCNRAQLLAYTREVDALRVVKMRKGQSAEFKPRNCIAGEALPKIIAHFRAKQGEPLLREKKVRGSKTVVDKTGENT